MTTGRLGNTIKHPTSSALLSEPIHSHTAIKTSERNRECRKRRMKWTDLVPLQTALWCLLLKPHPGQRFIPHCRLAQQYLSIRVSVFVSIYCNSKQELVRPNRCLFFVYFLTKLFTHIFSCPKTCSDFSSNGDTVF